MSTKKFTNDELLKREDDILAKIPHCFGKGGLHDCSKCEVEEECIKSKNRGRIRPEILNRRFTI